MWLFAAATGELLRTFTNPNDPIQYTQFGWAIAVADGRVVVGDPGFGVGRVDGDYDPDPSIGAAYVFDAASGALLQTIVNPTPISPDEWEDERFGAALAAVSGRVLVSDPSDQTLGNLAGGGVYVYADTTGCGDGAVDARETCDDGNLVNADGCDSNCVRRLRQRRHERRRGVRRRQPRRRRRLRLQLPPDGLRQRGSPRARAVRRRQRGRR